MVEIMDFPNNVGASELPQGNNWQSNFAAEFWKGRQSPNETQEVPQGPENIRANDSVVLSNGDKLSVGDTGWELLDKDGNPVTQVKRIDKGEIPGNTTWELSNGATLRLGSYANSIRYPNGDTAAWRRDGSEIFSIKLPGSPQGAPPERHTNPDEVRPAEGRNGEHIGGGVGEQLENSPPFERPKFNVQQQPFERPAPGLRMQSEPYEQPEGGNTYQFSNGDQLAVGPDGGVTWTDKDGNKIYPERVENYGVNQQTVMNNGAIFIASPAGDAIRYPNGDYITLSPEGEVLNGRLNGNKIA